MFTIKMQAIYGRLLILGLLLMCLFVFGYSGKVESVLAAPCIQDCEASDAACIETCAIACRADSTDAACNNCATSCLAEFQSCMKHAVFCRNADEPPQPNCQIGFADHCPVINGTANCSHSSAHSGYYAICGTIGGQQCVSCPDHDYCQGSNGLPPCY